MEENGLSIVGSHLLFNRSNFERNNFEAALLLKNCGTISTRGGRRKLLLFGDVLEIFCSCFFVVLSDWL